MNQILQSACIDLGEVKLPDWQGRQQYMHTFDPKDPVMAPGFEDYHEVVSQLCQAPPNQGYLLSPDCVHESMIFNQPTQRTFLRIAFSTAE